MRMTFSSRPGELWITPEIRQIVIPAKARIQSFQDLLDSRLRGNDKVGVFFKALSFGVRRNPDFQPVSAAIPFFLYNLALQIATENLGYLVFHLKMRLQLIEIIASNFPLLQGEGKGGDGGRPAIFIPLCDGCSPLKQGSIQCVTTC